MRPVYIVDALRTPRGRGKPGKGALSSVHPQELLAAVFRALTARNAVLAAGLPDGVTGGTLNRFCQ